MKTPCKGCEGRKPGCHGQCGEFMAWKAEQAEKHRRIEEERQRTPMLSRETKRHIWRKMRWR